MSIFVVQRAVAGPIGINCLQCEQVLVPCPLGPVRWSRGTVHRGLTATCNSRTGPSLLQPNLLVVGPSHVITLGYAALILHVC